MMVKFYILIGGIVILGLIALATIKALKKVDVKEKLEDIDETTEQYNMIKDVNVKEFQKQKKKLEEFKEI